MKAISNSTCRGVRQMRLTEILVMHLWPAVVFAALIYGLGPRYLIGGTCSPTWFVLLVMVAGNGLELGMGVVGGRSGLKGRRRRSVKWYIVAALVLILGVVTVNIVAPIQAYLANTALFGVPEWWPPMSNPNVPKSSVGDAFPDLILRGNWKFFITYVTIGLVFNVVGEELYYRGYLLPRMRGVFGRYDWLASSLLFTAKHVYQPWALPGIFVGALCFGIAAGPLGSVRLAVVYHWVGNYLLPVAMLFIAVA